MGRTTPALPERLPVPFGRLQHLRICGGRPGVPCSVFTRSIGPVIDIAPGEHARGWDALRDDTRKVHG